MNQPLLAIGVALIGQAGTLVTFGISLTAKRKAGEIKDRKAAYRDLVNQIRQGHTELLFLSHGSPHIRELVGRCRKSGSSQDIDYLLEEIDKELLVYEKLYEKRRKTARRFRRLSIVFLLSAGLLFLATAVGAEAFPNTQFGKFSRHLYALPVNSSVGRSIRDVPSTQPSWLPAAEDPATSESASPAGAAAKDSYGETPEAAATKGASGEGGVAASSAKVRGTSSTGAPTPSGGVSGAIHSCVVKPAQGIVGSALSNLAHNTVRNVSGCAANVVGGAANSAPAIEGAILPSDPSHTVSAGA
jgi:hypothetical protein